MIHNANQRSGKRLGLMFCLGMVSGFPLLLTGSTLQAWMTDAGISLSTIGLFSLVGLPYSLKFLWSFFLDRFTLSTLGRRRSWVLGAQIATAAAIFALSQLPNPIPVTLLFTICLAIAFFSATLDIALDALRRELFDDQHLGLATSFFVNGYRVGTLLSGAGILFLADHFSWPHLMTGAAIWMLLSTVILWITPEPSTSSEPPQHHFLKAITEPLRDFFSQRGSYLICAFILFYKLGDSLASSMTTPFFLNIGFSKTDIASLAKTLGLAASICGAFFAGTLLTRIPIRKALFIFGILQMFSTLFYALLALSGRNPVILGVGMIVEYGSAGMGGCALATYMGQRCSRRFAASQYALLSSLMGIPRVIFSSPMGFVAENTGWILFFILCTLIAAPGLFLIGRIPTENTTRPK